MWDARNIGLVVNLNQTTPLSSLLKLIHEPTQENLLMFEDMFDAVTKPLRDGLDIIDGLTEGELRTKAIASLGADVVAGMAVSELIEWYKN